MLLFLLPLLPLLLAPSFVLSIAPAAAPYPTVTAMATGAGAPAARLHVYMHHHSFCFIAHLCMLMCAQAYSCLSLSLSLCLFVCSCSFMHVCAYLHPLLSLLSSCCRWDPGPSYGICINNIVSVHSADILLTFKISTIHLNMKN